MQSTLKSAFIATIPVLTGYLVLGFGFGIVLKSAGFSILLALGMSVLIYAGSMQYAAVGLLSAGASLLTVFLTTVMVNARHIFYGISMLEKYRDTGKRKPYLIFSLTDETYSLLCRDLPGIPDEQKNHYYLFVSLFNQIYWIVGSLLGAAVGSLVHFNSEGIDFALTALFVTVFVEQWSNTMRHAPAIIGAAASVVSLLVFGSEHFLIPAMLVIVICLSLMREVRGDD